MPRSAMHFLALLLGCSAMLAQPGPKLEFEVASIKSSPPPAAGVGYTVGCRGGPGTNDPVLYVCGNISLSNLVTLAYGVRFYQLSAPDWTMTTRFDLRATVPAGTTKEQFATMMQNLLADRFKLVAHRETREIQRYELAVAKNGPKFKEAGGSARSRTHARAPETRPGRLSRDWSPRWRGIRT